MTFPSLWATGKAGSPRKECLHCKCVIRFHICDKCLRATTWAGKGVLGPQLQRPSSIVLPPIKGVQTHRFKLRAECHHCRNLWQSGTKDQVYRRRPGSPSRATPSILLPTCRRSHGESAKGLSPEASHIPTPVVLWNTCHMESSAESPSPPHKDLHHKPGREVAQSFGVWRVNRTMDTPGGSKAALTQYTHGHTSHAQGTRQGLKV